MGVFLALLLTPTGAAASPLRIAINGAWDVLPAGDSDAARRRALAKAGKLLQGRTLHLTGIELSGSDLAELAQTAPNEPFVRMLRETLKRPIDPRDLLLFLDDVARASGSKLANQPLHLTSGRARSVGVLLHPDDVFANKPRRYPAKRRSLSLAEPEEPDEVEPAPDDAPLGAGWTARFKNPETEEARLAALAKQSPSGTLHERVDALVKQMEAQGAQVWVTSTVRSRRRGYLMWGCFVLSRCAKPRCVRKWTTELARLNRAWDLHIPIRWRHPDGWRATVAAARAMKDAYSVVYATRRGARHSDHYDGVAVDLVALGLPRKLVLQAPNGTRATFDLSEPNEPRDLSLTPRLIKWVEKHFQLEKLRSDYPHWTDTAPAVQHTQEARNKP